MKAVKFSFDCSFDGGANDEAVRAADARKAELEEARLFGVESGMELGREQALAETEAHIAATVDGLVLHVSDALARLDAVAAGIRRDAVELAVLTARMLGAGAMARFPEESISELARGVIEQHMQASRLVVRVAESDLESIKGRLESHAGAIGFQGRIIFLGEASVMPGDCLVEWADGGVEHRLADRSAAIESAVQSYIASNA